MSNPIRVKCTHCSSTFRVKSAGAIGKTVDCPKCTGKFVIQKPRPKTKSKPKPKPAPELESDEDVFLADIDENRRARRKRSRSPQLEEGIHEHEEVPLALARPQLRRLKKKRDATEDLEDEDGWLSMGFPRWIIGGCLGSLLGIALWVFMGYLIPFPFGWIAVGMGFTVGLGVRLASGESDGLGPGITAAVITLVSIIIAKFLTAIVIAAWFAGRFVGLPADVEELSIQQIADEIVDERVDAGENVDWPEKQPLFWNASQDISENYPPDIWDEATKRWEEAPIAEQQERREEAENEQERAEEDQEEFEGSIVGDIFIFSFGWLDFIWIPIAAFSAFQLGANIADN